MYTVIKLFQYFNTRKLNIHKNTPAATHPLIIQNTLQ